MKIEDYALPPPTRWERIRSKMVTLIPALIRRLIHFVQVRFIHYVIHYVLQYVLRPVCDLIARLIEVIQFIIHRNPVSSLINWHYHPARRNSSWFTWLADVFITLVCMVVGAFIVPGIIVTSIVYLGCVFGFWSKDAKAIIDSIIEYIEYILGCFGIHTE